VSLLAQMGLVILLQIQLQWQLHSDRTLFPATSESSHINAGEFDGRVKYRNLLEPSIGYIKDVAANWRLHWGLVMEINNALSPLILVDMKLSLMHHWGNDFRLEYSLTWLASWIDLERRRLTWNFGTAVIQHVWINPSLHLSFVIVSVIPSMSIWKNSCSLLQ